jgi:DNA recombination protein RmuC
MVWLVLGLLLAVLLLQLWLALRPRAGGDAALAHSCWRCSRRRSIRSWHWPGTTAPWSMAQQLLGLSHQLSQHQQAASDSLRKLVDGRMAQSLAEARASRQELQQHFQQLQEAMAQQLHRLQQGTLHNAEQLRTTLNERLSAIQTDNADKLEEMRRTVDEKLHATLEQRLGESFKLVSDRLEQVHKGLGEMQTLAGSVGDLKRVMTNVKSRGTWGELQLGASSTTCSPRAVRQERQDRAGQR